MNVMEPKEDVATSGRISSPERERDDAAEGEPVAGDVPDPSSGSGMLRAHADADPGRECEKSGLIEIVLVRERYRAILEIGCGNGQLARLLVERCTRYTGMDADPGALVAARRQVAGAAETRFVSLALPFTLPGGEHDLVVLSGVLQLLDDEVIADVAQHLAGHAACREIVVVSSRDGLSKASEPALDAFVAAVGGGFVHEELAMRRHYRIDALVR